MSIRKPHSGNVGYVSERKCAMGGHIVIYDRQRGFECDADYRYIIAHEPSGQHISVSNLRTAYALMYDLASGK